jgi:tetratricopeptide (TPR) repeat protein
MKQATALKVFLLVLSPAFFSSCLRPRKSVEGSQAAGGAERSARPAPPQAGSGPCAERYQALKKLFDSLPRDFRSPGRPLEQVAREVEEGKKLAESLLAECGSSPLAAEVAYMEAFLILVTFERSVQAGEVKPETLADRVQELLGRAAAAAPAGSLRAAECLNLTAHLLKKRASYQPDPELRRRDWEAMRESCRKLLSQRPDWPERRSIQLSIADSFMAEGEFQEARAHLETLALDSGGEEVFNYQEKLFDALSGCGALEAMEALVVRRQADYPERLLSPRITLLERQSMEVWLDLAEFWLGHIRFALGDIPGARAALLRHITQLDEKEAELKARGELLPNTPRIFRDLRSRDLLDFIDHYLGKPPELDFDFGDLWATSSRVTLKSARGKVVAALFRNPDPGDRASAQFLQGLERLWRRDRSRGLEMLVAGFLVGVDPPAAQLEAMREEMKSLKVDLPAGLDPHRPEPAIFQAMHANWGSPSFVVFDREGRLAWYLLDPRPKDLGVAERVLTRLLSAPAPQSGG